MLKFQKVESVESQIHPKHSKKMLAGISKNIRLYLLIFLVSATGQIVLANIMPEIVPPAYGNGGSSTQPIQPIIITLESDGSNVKITSNQDIHIPVEQSVQWKCTGPAYAAFPPVSGQPKKGHKIDIYRDGETTPSKHIDVQYNEMSQSVSLTPGKYKYRVDKNKAEGKIEVGS